MINKIFIKILSVFINMIDLQGKKKVIHFFKNKFNKESLNIIDVGAHKGETINLFFNNFNINKILAFEANPVISKKLKKRIKKDKYQNKINLINCGVGEKEDIKNLIIFNESSSSTFNPINKDSKYYKRKEKILSFLKFNKNNLQNKLETRIYPLSHFKEAQDFKKIDILKIDTEGYELNILKGLSEDQLKKIKYIYFEHHYDLMIKKSYTYHDIKNFLNKNNFYLSLKLKMNFRKTFEYIYENKN
jgi:FkbM family methyltransferase